jgi:hypothetical protein
VESFVKQLNAVLESRTSDLPYGVSLSVGYSVYQGAEQSIEEWISMADQDLYEKRGSDSSARRKSSKVWR